MLHNEANAENGAASPDAEPPSSALSLAEEDHSPHPPDDDVPQTGSIADRPAEEEEEEEEEREKFAAAHLIHEPPSTLTGCLFPRPRFTYDQSLRTGRFPRVVPQTLSNLCDLTVTLRPLSDLAKDEFDSVRDRLVDNRRGAAGAHEFAAGTHLNAALSHLDRCEIEQKKRSVQRKASADYASQVCQLDATEECYDLDARRQEANLLAHLLDGKQRLLARHRAELDAHAAKWAGPRIQRIYNRGSVRLRNLRADFRRCMLTCNFADAAAFDGMIAQTEAADATEASTRWGFDYDGSRAKLLSRHAAELRFFDQQTEVHLANLRNRRNVGTLLFANKRRDAEHRRSQVEDLEKCWTMYQREKMLNKQKTFAAHTPQRLSPDDLPDREEPVAIRPPMRFTRSIRTAR
jgi:hypothetical protein